MVIDAGSQTEKTMGIRSILSGAFKALTKGGEYPVPKIGDRVGRDGTEFYSGINPETGRHMYATSKDEAVQRSKPHGGSMPQESTVPGKSGGPS
jgi:hypothetical protein